MTEKSDLAIAMEGSVKYNDGNYLSFSEPPQVKLEVFRDEYLPAFIKEDAPTIAKWVNGVGSPNTRVNIVNSAGEILFWVPQISYGLVSNDTDAIVNETDAYEKTKEINVAGANLKLMQFFSQNVKLASPPQTDIDQWKFILKYFNIASGPVEDDSLPDEEVEYDDF